MNLLVADLITGMVKGILTNMFIFYIISSLIANTLPRFIDLGTYEWLKDAALYSDKGCSWFHTGQALSILLLGLAFPHYDKESVLHKRVLLSIMCCMVSNLADELFFDPIHLGYNEIFLVPVSLLTIFLLPKQWIIKHQ